MKENIPTTDNLNRNGQKNLVGHQIGLKHPERPWIIPRAPGLSANKHSKKAVQLDLQCPGVLWENTKIF